MKSRRNRSLLAAAVLVVALPGTALAQTPPAGVCDPEPAVTDDAEYPPGRGTVAIGATVVTPGALIEIDGDDWSCETTVEITAVSPTGTRQTLGTARVDSLGTFSTSVVIPEGVQDGVAIEVAGTDRTGVARVDAVDVTVQTSDSGVSTFALGQDTAAAEVADDGAVNPWLVLTGLAALASVAGLIVSGRRRERQE